MLFVTEAVLNGGFCSRSWKLPDHISYLKWTPWTTVPRVFFITDGCFLFLILKPNPESRDGEEMTLGGAGSTPSWGQCLGQLRNHGRKWSFSQIEQAEQYQGDSPGQGLSNLASSRKG